MKKRPIFIAVLVLSLQSFAFAEDRPHPVNGLMKVLVLSGQGNDWLATSSLIRQILTNTGRFDVRVCESPTGLSPRTLADFDVLVNNCGNPGLGSETEQAVKAFVESGKGLVICHGAMSSSAGLLGSDSSVQIDLREHPITRSITKQFLTTDSPCAIGPINREAEVIATVGDGRAVLAAFKSGRGRIVDNAMGHDLAAMHSKEFITILARSTEWAATGAVTLPADIGLVRPSADAIKCLVITGGHDHETSFYSLFDGNKDLARTPVAPSSTAFQNDLRFKYDVLIMYDFSRQLDEKGMKHLREFVESKHGIVVLHHALLNYQDWPWWSEEVVGGRYRLKREGNIPSSTVKNDQTFFLTTESSHSITAGLGAFQVVDETYKGMYFSPRIRPLVWTDNPNSDRVVAWIGPCSTSRVAAIQLGHGPTIFGHPSYRALVHNAILWAAGRLK